MSKIIIQQQDIITAVAINNSAVCARSRAKHLQCCNYYYYYFWLCYCPSLAAQSSSSFLSIIFNGEAAHSALTDCFEEILLVHA